MNVCSAGVEVPRNPIFRRHRQTSLSWGRQTSTPDHYLPQLVDHFDPIGNQTFQQRFWMNDTFSDGNTLLFAFGGEAPLQEFYGVSNNILADLAQEHSALLIYLEHRYYGQSLPLNSSSTNSLKYLSTAQALADAAYFYDWATANLPLNGSNLKMVTFGCSYSGMLSAFFRTRYPQLAQGAVAGSAPVEAILDFPQYDETVKDVLGSNCSSIVEAAFNNITSLWSSSSGKKAIQQAFNVCQDISSFELADVTSAISGFIQGAVQGNNPDAHFPVTTLCDMLEKEKDASGNLNALAVYIHNMTGSECLDIDAVKQLKQVGADRSWTFQTCTEYGFFQTDETSKIFGNTIGLDYYLNLCKAAFEQSLMPATNFTNINFGGLHQSGSNILFTNGLQDPWGANLGINKPLGNNLNVTLYTGAHCAPFHPPTDQDPENLKQSREIIKSFVSNILK